MKFTGKSAAIVAALAMATTGVFALNQTESTADAATVATVHQGVTARLYTQNGSLVKNRALAPNTSWQVGKISNINGVTMYQVSTNEYLKASDSSIMGADANSSKQIGKAAFAPLSLYRDDTNKMANRSLAKNSSWQIGKFIRNKNNQEFVQVSTHEYADAALMAYNHPMTNPTYIADFGTNTDFTVIKVGNGDLGTGTPVTPSQPSTGTDTGSSSNGQNQPVASTQAIQQAILKSINDARATKGTAPVALDSTLTNIAMKRAQESVTNFSHIRADGNHWYAELKQVAPSYAARGENLFLSPWNQLPKNEQTATGYANLVMDNFKGEGEGSTTNWTHYTGVLDPKANKVGIGVYVESDSTVYIAEDFAG
ncbi:CAP domain-containing protein [Companilactobacillus heilongjiangensis]|uniref:SCP domain-containing protein n=1 Tax=Companilactobacillus heilongjiangensis TaxID=1074467 RepID=A0A0K2LF86_9LACO|nr:CAP domain-containing protein [Companilactobacillus heilongjiangensis]ALB29848.1 hypothetical protein JP39_11065 [Companilactobacillus heilongjiangensis]